LEIGTSSYQEIKTCLEHNDYIFVCGGNPIYLLMKLKETGADQLLKEQINQGKVYIGESSGSVILTKNIEYVLSLAGPEKVELLNNYDALNLIEFYPVPHYQTFPFAEKTATILEQDQELNLAPITNNQVIEVFGSQYEIKTALIN
jgi:dipeptidase E